MAVIKDYGLMEFMEKGAYALHKENQIVRYYKMLGKRENGYAITTFPFGKQFKYEDFDQLFAQYGFKNKIPDIKSLFLKKHKLLKIIDISIRNPFSG